MRKLLVVLALGFLLLAAVPAAPGQCYQSNAGYQGAGGYADGYETVYEYWGGGHWQGRYYAAGYYAQRVKRIIQRVAVNPDVYYSTTDYYRDKQLTDAVAGRVAELLRDQKESRPADAATAEAVQAPALPAKGRRPAQDALASRHQNPALLKVVNDHCARCHGAAKQDAGLALVTAQGKLADVPAAKLDKAFRLVFKGTMPKAAAPLEDKAVELFEAWADSSSGRARAAPAPELEYFPPAWMAHAPQCTPATIVQLQADDCEYVPPAQLRLRLEKRRSVRIVEEEPIRLALLRRPAVRVVAVVDREPVRNALRLVLLRRPALRLELREDRREEIRQLQRLRRLQELRY